MKRYVFFDTDITGRAEYDLTGEEHRKFLLTCFKYSATVSFWVSYDVFLPERMREMRLPINDDMRSLYAYHSKDISETTQIWHLPLNVDVCEYLLGASNSIWEWLSTDEYKAPEDIVFYRADSSVFFTSVIHDGECLLTVNDDEDVSEIIKNHLWLPEAEWWKKPFSGYSIYIDKDNRMSVDEFKTMLMSSDENEDQFREIMNQIYCGEIPGKD